MPQEYAPYIAIFVASLALLMVSWKMWSDRAFRAERLSFERSERAIRENHERNETRKREAFEQSQAAANSAERTAALDQLREFQAFEREEREMFEASEQTLRLRFMAQQEHASTDAEARIKQQIEAYIKLEKWREGSWQRNVSRLEQASQDLSGTTSGVISLIDEGPYFSDERMILETARVLDVFGSFQTSVSHFGMPIEMSALSKQLIGLITKILLSLSPSQAVRNSDGRKALLAPLRDELRNMSRLFLCKCGDFERDPSAFVCSDSDLS
ncbi:MAG: hypothetical protein V4484_22275 [Pseudomonadota bacterium]